MYYATFTKDEEHKPFKDLNVKTAPMVSLSGGRYDEFFNNDSLVAIDNAVVSMNIGRIKKFIDKPLRPDGPSRWLSPDPLGQKFPSISPYASLGDNPIIYVDPDGRDNVIYLVVLPSAYGKDKMTANQIKDMIANANANFGKLGLNTTVVLFDEKISGNKAFNKSYMDKTDAVAVIGGVEDVKKYVRDNNLSELKGWSGSQAGNAGWEGGPNNPEESDGGLSGRGNVIMLDAAALAKDATEFNGKTINHGAGHTAQGIEILRYDKNHNIIPEIMNDGDDEAAYFRQNRNGKLSDFVKPANNEGYKKLIEDRFQPDGQKATPNYEKKRENAGN